MNNKLTLIIPAFNEKDRITYTLSEIEAFINLIPDLIEQVIVVDDGSTDSGRTIEAAIYYTKRIPLLIIRLGVNQGKWAAIHEGIKNSKTDSILLLDADGSASINELKRIKKLRLLIGEKTSIFGSRFSKKSKVEGKTAFRKFVSVTYKIYVNFMYWFATGKKNIEDMQAPFKLIYKSRITKDLIINRFAGDIELACAINGPIINHPLHFIHMQGSTIKSTTAIKMAIDTFKVCFKHKFNK